MPEKTLTAEYVFPVDQPPLRNGTITMRDGRIDAVEPHGQRTADEDLGNAALLPGFVNTHTHLDLSGLHEHCPPSPDFTGWLRKVIAHRQAQTAEQTEEHIRNGLQQAIQTGTTLLGDISSGGQSRSILVEVPMWSVVFYELLGLPIERARQSWDAAKQWLDQWPDSTRCRLGLSPHAPYSVRRQLLEWAAETDCPVAMHLAESMAEKELLANHEGPFVSFLQELGVWDEGGLIGGFAEATHIFRDHSKTIFAHGNYLDPAELAGGNATIVYCPRTHHAFGHPPHPFRAMLEQDVRVALGTDSLASNPDLDMLAETRFVRKQYPDFPGDVLLRMATLSGAEALGFDAVTGSLTPGKSADVVVMQLPNDERPDPHDLIFDSKQCVARVMWRGEWAV